MLDANEKRVAQRALRTAGRQILLPLNVNQIGSSPRQWVGDRGWWIINVEFQASSGSIASYLNVGLQHLWNRSEARSFSYSYRHTIPGYGSWADLGGEPDVVLETATAVASAAGEVVRQWDSLFASDFAHFLWLAQLQESSGYAHIDAAIALARLGKTTAARNMFLSELDTYDEEIEWQAEQKEDRRFLADLVLNIERFNSEIDDRIETTRTALRLNR